jgi:hypothetical protein
MVRLSEQAPALIDMLKISVKNILSKTSKLSRRINALETPRATNLVTGEQKTSFVHVTSIMRMKTLPVFVKLVLRSTSDELLSEV